MQLYDIVIPVKPSEINEDLRYTLRSIAKFGGSYGRVWLAGYKPAWVTNVGYIPCQQAGTKWSNARDNLIAACHHPDVSQQFILFNDDFILTEKVGCWDTFANCYLGTLEELGEKFQREHKIFSKWTRGFFANHGILKALGVDNPLDFEYHGPIIYDKSIQPRVCEIPFIRKEVDRDRNFLIFHRSLYHNLFPSDIEPRRIEDHKIWMPTQDDDGPWLSQYGFFSVADNVIGDRVTYPKLHSWLDVNIGEPCKFERGFCSFYSFFHPKQEKCHT